jgi:hypothetical protein
LASRIRRCTYAAEEEEVEVVVVADWVEAVYWDQHSGKAGCVVGLAFRQEEWSAVAAAAVAQASLVVYEAFGRDLEGD